MESVCRRNPTEGSNPSLSATSLTSTLGWQRIESSPLKPAATRQARRQRSPPSERSALLETRQASAQLAKARTRRFVVGLGVRARGNLPVVVLA